MIMVHGGFRFCFLLILVLALAGCSGSAHPPSTLVLGETVLYREDEPPSIRIKVGDKWREISSAEDYPSKPIISSDKGRLAFISPFEFELAGEVWLYDTIENKKEKIFTLAQANEGNSAKRLYWVDDSHLLVLTGNIYGTVSLNRTLYLVNIESKQTQSILALEDDQDIRDLKVNNQARVTMNIATYNEQLIEAETKSKVIDITDLLK